MIETVDGLRILVIASTNSPDARQEDIAAAIACQRPKALVIHKLDISSAPRARCRSVVT